MVEVIVMAKLLARVMHFCRCLAVGLWVSFSLYQLILVGKGMSQFIEPNPVFVVS